jgi:tetratricopeptide (TPR) repeat protein
MSRVQKRIAVGLAVVLAVAALAALAAVVMRRRSGRADWPTAGTAPAAGAGPTVVATSAPAGAPVAAFVGRQACAPCHARETDLWIGSHHDLAMQEATAATVVGHFDNARFNYHGVVSTFYRKEGKYFVRTDGPDGKLHDYPIAYTFGVDPLQQYLIAFPGGRYQALNVCWDTRPKARGGQRWFHLYPDENVTHNDILHWTGPYQNWNHMCAECHSTNVRKNYFSGDDRFETSWSEIDVSCEACHGPGSAHVAWAKAGRGLPDKGLVFELGEGAPISWIVNPTTGIAAPDEPRRSRAEVETCARCHARRSVVSEPYAYGRPLLDTHRPALLDPLLYEDDGQIKDEVYEYGSFLQSRMYAAGVTCSDCHNPHSLKPARENIVCSRCHLPEKFDTPAHHFHKQGGKGSACTACHMPTRNYMVVHARHDHSFRVPRPDLTVSIGTPNACAPCHQGKPVKWLADAATKWWGTKLSARPRYGTALHAGNRGLPGAYALLAAVIDDSLQPGIVRATAAGLLGDLGGSRSTPMLEGALRDPDPLVRDAAVQSLRDIDAGARARLLAALLTDPVRTVRIDAGRGLATVPPSLLSPDRQEAAAQALREWRAEQMVNADRAEAHLTLGALHAERGEFADGEREYRTALRLSPRFPATYLNFADLYRQQDRDPEGEAILRQGLRMAPGDPRLLHVLGLLLVRRQRLPEALMSLEKAAVSTPDVARYAYVYGVALQSVGRIDRAMTVLRTALQRHPGNAEILVALATISRDAGRLDDAIEYAGRLVALLPDDQEARRLLEQLQAARR